MRQGPTSFTPAAYLYDSLNIIIILLLAAVVDVWKF